MRLVDRVPDVCSHFTKHKSLPVPWHIIRYTAVATSIEQLYIL